MFSESANAFDEWSSHQTHYVCVFAVFPNKEFSGFTKFLLRFSTFGNEKFLDSASRIDFLEFVLSIFNKSLENVMRLIGDNCATNKAVADLLQTQLVGCYSHRFHLAVEEILGDYDDVIESVYRIMVSL